MFGSVIENQAGINVREVPHDVVAIAAAVTLTPSQLTGWVTSPASSSYAITLPAAQLCKGRYAFFYCTNTGGGQVSFASNAGDLIALSVGDNLSAAGDYVALYCNGYKWIVLEEVTT